MGSIVWIVVLVLLITGVFYLVSQSNARKARELDDAKAEARRWVERLGGQVMSISGTDAASTQAMADASERFTAAGSQMEQARTIPQARLVTETAMEGLHYVRAAREAMGMDPGPALPDDGGPGQGRCRQRGPSGRRRGPPVRRLAELRFWHAVLLPRRHGRGPPGAPRLVLRAVVEARTGGGCLGRRHVPADGRHVLRHARRRRLRHGRRRHGWGRHGPWTSAAIPAASTSATWAAASTSSPVCF